MFQTLRNIMQYKPSMACSAAQGLPLGLLLGFWVLQELRIGKPVDTGHIQKPHGKRWTTLVKRATCVGVSLAVMLLLVVENASGSKSKPGSAAR